MIVPDSFNGGIEINALLNTTNGRKSDLPLSWSFGFQQCFPTLEVPVYAHFITTVSCNNNNFVKD